MPHYRKQGSYTGSVKNWIPPDMLRENKRKYDVTGCCRGTKKKCYSQSHFFVEQMSVELFSTKHLRHCPTLLLAHSQWEEGWRGGASL